MTDARRAAVVAVIAVLCAAGWMALNVIALYEGNINGLFLTGTTAPVPPILDAGHTYRTNDPKGYDGQFYHFIAHDPLILRRFLDFVDNPRLRWRRIGLPGLAAVLAFGNDAFVDWAYVALELGFLFLGTFWLGLYAMAQRLPAMWGLTFLAIPAVAVSVDRLTVDLPLAALCAGLAVFASGRAEPQEIKAKESERRGRWIVIAMLCGAALFRETGMLIVAALCLSRIFQRDWRGACAAVATAVPAAAWWIYVAGRTPVDGTAWLSTYPFSGLIQRILSGTGEPASTLWLHTADVLESVALAGVCLALALAFYFLWKRRTGWLEITAILFALFAATLGKFDLWSSAYATGRTMSPLLTVLGLAALRDRRVVFAVPLLLVLPRIALQYEAQFSAALKNVLSAGVR
jgi:hypothetical protein